MEFRNKMPGGSEQNDNKGEGSNRIVISVIGPDRVGIIAAVSNILAKHNINILDIRQTIMQEFFVMILIADMEKATVDLLRVKDLLNRKGEELQVRIDAQHEDVFNFMHRI